MASKRRKSSVGRLLSGLIPQRRASQQNPIDLSPLEAVLLVSYQLAQTDPLVLAPLAFCTARVLGSEELSFRAHSILLEIGVIGHRSHEHDAHVLPVVTSKITRHFANQLFFCTGHSLRRIVTLLFFWEEECMRLRWLDREEYEIRTLLNQSSEGLKSELRIRLESVHMRRVLLPSQREDDAVTSLEGPPAYVR